MFVFLAKGDGTPMVIAGPCWPFCCFVTLPLILGASGAVSYWLILRDNAALPLWVAYIYFPVLGFVLAALFSVSCQDPGLMERVTDEEAGEGGWFWNEQVGSYRPPGALYCRECGVLIQDYDHLCVCIIQLLLLRFDQRLIFGAVFLTLFAAFSFFTPLIAMDWNWYRSQEYGGVQDFPCRDQHSLLFHRYSYHYRLTPRSVG